MGKIKVNVATVVSSGNSANNAKAIVNSNKNRIANIKNSIDGRIRSSDNIEGRINNIVNTLSQAEGKITRLKIVVDTCVNDYRNVDNKVKQMAQETAKFATPASNAKKFIIDKEILRKLLFLTNPGLGTAVSIFSFLNSEGWKNFMDGNLIATKEGSVWFLPGKNDESFLKIITGKLEASLSPEYGEHENKKGLGEYIYDKSGKKINVDQQTEDYKQINKDEKFYEKATTIFEAKAEAKAEGSVVDVNTSGSNDWAEGSAGVKVLTGEAHAEAAAGLYRFTKDSDGKIKKIFSPSVSAEVGASASVLDASAEGRIGLGKDKNMLGVYGNANVKALSAEAKAGVGFIPGKQAYAGASAEANLVKAEGAAGVSVLGTDIGVTAGVKVGVGAHANAGYTDGKLKVDVGAAVGVGFDLGFEVDVGGTVDAVRDVASNAWEGISSAWNKLF